MQRAGGAVVGVGKDDEPDVKNEQDEIDVADEEADDLDTVDDGDDAWESGRIRKQPVHEDFSEREELARFREEWKAEVMRNRRGTTATSSRPDPPKQPAAETEAAKVVQPTSPPVHVQSQRLPADPKSAAPGPVVLPPSKDPASLPLPPKLSKALEIYEQAVVHEQRSELDEALRLYRQAFRLDENVSRVYERLDYHARARSEGLQKPRKAVHEETPAGSKRRSDTGLELAQDFSKLGLANGTSPPSYGVATGTLAHLVASWPSNVGFEPEDEAEPVHLRILPEELLVHISQYLDVTALERFGTINRKARVLTLDPTIWRERAEQVYKPPQIPDDEHVGTLLARHMQDYRRLYIEQPRVRLDGVYIAVCHYIRDGLSENSWVHVSHLITYHRYLRFLPNGDVLSLLTNEEVPPPTVIPILKPGLKMKGLLIGQWRLDGTTVYVTNLMDPHGSTLKYSFQMTLDLRSRPLGRWNRLDFRAYDSVSLESGEATPLALKNDRPFWFSKVRSYIQHGAVGRPLAV